MTATSATRSPRLLVISGSARTGSLNSELAELAAHKARALGAETSTVDLRALGLPVFDADLLQAQGMPQGALQLRDWMAQHDGVLLASPEYNALPTPLFINAFDWLSVVQAEGEAPSGTGATAGKPVGLLAASPGALGGIRALPIVRTYLSTNFAMVVVPEQLALPLADQQLSAERADRERLAKPELDAVLDRLVASVVKQARWRLA
ncbi:NAD(P)H-dependent FMN reductase [Aquabacterium commune]|uniref:NAD(P)H-dependent FMN reductase n=1 Tax=Aquabacterium commune TaxID=70586 RepID=A0A4R6RNP1_9BURK|nr:NAD(P)H-dependent oxidoreductase [Aquabacterium commune]TDP88361.1 NAD(P)H-dependent FMN reductase [Aquabacterium commune]